jgi:hypothetical protein
MPIEVPDYIIDVRDGRFDAPDGRARLRARFDALAASGDTRPLVIHFHGGLVSRQSGTNIANTLAPVYREAGGEPLFLVWQAGWDETIRNNATEILDEALRELLRQGVLKVLLKKALRIAAGKLGLGDGSRSTTAVSDAEIEAELAAMMDAETATAEPFADRGLAVDAGTEITPVEQEFLEAELSADPEVEALALQPDAGADSPEFFGPDGSRSISALAIAKAIVAVAVRTLGRFLAGRDHGLYCTVLEEALVETYIARLGQLLQWNRMKRDTADAFGPDPDRHVGTALLAEIARLHAVNPRRVVLVGHSTGAVYICHLLKHTSSLPPGVKFDLVMLAPACTFDLFAETIAEFDDRIANVRMFGMSDAVECADQVVPRVFPRSLLYLVSGVLEENERDRPLLGMQRYFRNSAYDGIPSVRAVREYFRQRQNWEVWSLTDAGAASGLASHSPAHGAFDSEGETLKSVSYLIAHGYV